MTRLQFLVFLWIFCLAGCQECGVNKYKGPNVFTSRIVGGRSASRGEIPWQVSLMLNHPLIGPIDHFCGGVILNRYWILTTAHCFLSYSYIAVQPSYWTVRLGEHDLRKVDPNEKWYKVASIHYHKNYILSQANDIALIKLKDPVQTNEDVGPVCLAVPSKDYKNESCFASGWGKIDKTLDRSDVLKVVRVNIYSNEFCDKQYRALGIPIRSSHLCAGNIKGKEGTCQGDSGGPLSCFVDGRWHLIGITSFGKGCAEVDYPGVYTRVASYASWMQRIMSAFA